MYLHAAPFGKDSIKAVVAAGRLRSEKHSMQTAPTRSVGRRKRSHEIAELLEKAISGGEFEVGSQLPSEKVLAERFGVGPAFGARGAVPAAAAGPRRRHQRYARAGHRARPTACSSASCRLHQAHGRDRQGQTQMEQTRLLFEAGVAWQAAQVATDEDIERLKKALDANVAAMGNTPSSSAPTSRSTTSSPPSPGTRSSRPCTTILVEWLIDQRTTTIHMPDADRFSVRDHTSIYEAVAAHDPMRAFHEMASHLRLISQLYHESKRLSRGDPARHRARRRRAHGSREAGIMWAAPLRDESRGKRRAARRPASGAASDATAGAEAPEGA